jgi:hypothetical protein
VVLVVEVEAIALAQVELEQLTKVMQVVPEIKTEDWLFMQVAVAVALAVLEQTQILELLLLVVVVLVYR